MPVDNREKVDSILAAVTEVAGATENLWIHRQKFNEYHQKSNQPFKLFYSDLVTLALLGKFDEGLCDADKQKVDLFLLNKIIFSIHDRAVQKILFEEKELNLTKAIKIIEAYEKIQKTEETSASPAVKRMIFVDDQLHPNVSRSNAKSAKRKTSEKPPRSLRKPDYRQQCSRCG